MSRYRSYGQLDDPFVTEGDTFFLRMNARLRPNQLKPGEVALSKNGRMNDDGTWQPRKGLSTLFGSITSGTDAIRLPYIISSASRSSGVVSIVLDDTPSLSFIPGDNITIADLGFTTDSPNGTFPLESVNFTTKQITYISSSFVKHNGVFYKCLQDNTSSSSNEPGTVGGSSFWSSSTNASNASVWSASSVSYNGPGVDEPFAVRNASVGNTSVCSVGNSIATTLNFTLNDDGVNAVYGSAVYSDASSNNDDYIFSATNNVAVIIRLKDSALFKCRYEGGGETVDGPVGMTQGFDKMFIFRSRKTTLSASPALNEIGISSATQSGQVITVNTSTDHGRVVGDFVTLTNLGSWTVNPNACYQVVTAPTTTQFTVKMAGSQTATFNVSGASAEYFEDFTRVSNGTYTAPAYFTDTSVSTVDGVVTMNISAGHNLSIGNEIVIRSATTPIDLFLGKNVVVTSVSASPSYTPTASLPYDTFTFNLGVENLTGKSVTVSKQLAIGKGFIHQPAAPWGQFHQRRLWVPYWFTSDTSPTDRNNRSEIIASDILDSDTYDRIGNQFTITAGKSDFLIGIQPFTQDTLVIFNRKSIHLMTGVSGSLSDVSTNVVTTEIGASARKSIVQVANQILFLSDQGIYAVEFMDEYNLRGTSTPLSESIQPYIDRINQDYANLSTGVYFNSRYWLAVPLDSAPGRGDATKLNTIIIYNFINGGFESIDQVNSTEFAIRDLIVAREGAQNALYLTTEEGGVHKVDGFEGGDVVSLTAGQAESETIPVVSQLTTRQYDADSMDRKTYSRSELHLKSNTGFSTDGNIQFITEDPDSTTQSTSISSLLGGNLPDSEEASVRLRVNKRGFGVQADFQPTNGRPYLRSTKVDARITDRSTTSIS